MAWLCIITVTESLLNRHALEGTEFNDWDFTNVNIFVNIYPPKYSLSVFKKLFLSTDRCPTDYFGCFWFVSRAHVYEEQIKLKG